LTPKSDFKKHCFVPPKICLLLHLWFTVQTTRRWAPADSAWHSTGSI